MKNATKTIPYWKQIIYIMTLGWIVIWIYRTALTPIYPQLSNFFGNASGQQLGLISSSYFFGYVCTQIPSGILVDKYGKRKVLIPGFILFAIGTIVVAFSTSLPILYLGSALAGIGCGTYYGVAYSLTGTHVPKEKKSLSTAIVNSGSAVGSGLGLVASSYVVKQLGLPWQYVIFVITGLIVVMALVFYKFIRVETKTSDTLAVTSDTQTDVAQQSVAQGLFKPGLIAAYVLYFATCYAFYLIDTWLPDFLASERQMDGMEGLVTSVVFFAAIPGALLFSRIADKFYHKKIALIVLLEVVAATMLLVAIVASQQIVLILCLGLYGFFGKLAVEPIIISWISDKTKGKNIATTLGVFNFFGMSSAVVAPSLTGWIDDVFGSKQFAFYLAIVLLVIGAFVFFVTNKLLKGKADA